MNKTLTTQEFIKKFLALDIHSKFKNLYRIQQEFDKNKASPEVKNTQQELIKWMRQVCFEDENFIEILNK